LPGPHERQGRRGAGSRDWGRSRSGRLTPGSTESVRPGRKILTAADRRIGLLLPLQARASFPDLTLPVPASLQERPAAVHGPTGPSLKATNSATGAVPALAKYFLWLGQQVTTGRGYIFRRQPAKREGVRHMEPEHLAPPRGTFLSRSGNEPRSGST
jgi:hypothetical protein